MGIKKWKDVNPRRPLYLRGKTDEYGTSWRRAVGEKERRQAYDEFIERESGR